MAVGSILIRHNPVTLWETYHLTAMSLASAGLAAAYFSEYSPTDRADAGPYGVTFRLHAREQVLKELFQNGLDRHVEAWGDGLQADFEGSIIRMRLVLPPDSFSVSLKDVLNSVHMRVDYDADGEPERSTTLTEPDSIDRFGTIERVLSGGEMEGLTVADQAVQTYLALRSMPQPDARLGDVRSAEEYLEITAQGYLATLERRIYNQTAVSGTESMSAQISTIIGNRASVAIAAPAAWDQEADFEEGDTSDFDAENGSETTLQPDESAAVDAYIESGAPTTNYGTAGVVGVGESSSGTNVVRTLIKFDLSGIPAGATINSAVLSLYATADFSSTARTFRVYRQKRVWVEGEATWNIYSSGNNWQTAGGFGANDCEQTDIGSRAFSASEMLNQFKDFSLTPSAIEEMLSGGSWTNNGFLIKADTESNDQYNFLSSSDGTAANRPKLVINYTVGFAAAAEARYRGGYGLTVEASGYGELAGPTNAVEITAEIALNPNSLTMANGDEFVIMAGVEAGAAVDAWRLILGYNAASGYYLRQQWRTDAAAYASGSQIWIPDAWRRVGIYWKASTGAGANNGVIALLRGGQPVEIQTGLDTDTLNVDTVRYGAVSGVDVGTSGTFYLDECRWSDETGLSEVTAESGVGPFIAAKEISANPTALNKEHDSDRKALDIVQGDAALGDADNQRWVPLMRARSCTQLTGRTFILRQAAPAEAPAG